MPACTASLNEAFGHRRRHHRGAPSAGAVPRRMSVAGQIALRARLPNQADDALGRDGFQSLGAAGGNVSTRPRRELARSAAARPRLDATAEPARCDGARTDVAASPRPGMRASVYRGCVRASSSEPHAGGAVVDVVAQRRPHAPVAAVTAARRRRGGLAGGDGRRCRRDRRTAVSVMAALREAGGAGGAGGRGSTGTRRENRPLRPLVLMPTPMEVRTGPRSAARAAVRPARAAAAGARARPDPPARAPTRRANPRTVVFEPWSRRVPAGGFHDLPGGSPGLEPVSSGIARRLHGEAGHARAVLEQVRLGEGGRPVSA